MVRTFFMFKRFFVTMVTLVVFLSGCVFSQPSDHNVPIVRPTPSDNPKETLPESQTQKGNVSVDGPLTLAQSVQLALANNPEIAATKWDVSAAVAKRATAQADRWPTLSFEAGYMHNLDDQRLVPARYTGEPGIFDTDMSRGDLIINLPLFTGGRITNTISAAELLEKSQEQRLARTREELVFNVSNTFYLMLGQLEVIRSLEFSVTAMEEHRMRVSELMEAQKAAKVDLLRTEVRLADLQQNLMKQRNVFAIEKRLLANLLGIDNLAESYSITGTLAIPPHNLMPVQKLISVALNKRNDFLAAKASLEAQAKMVDVATAGYWPTVALHGSYGARLAGSGESEDVGLIGLTMSVPLFEGGRTKGQINQELASLKAAQERLRKLQLQIRQEVETAMLDTQSSSKRIDATRWAIDQAKESLRIERMKYDLGSGSMTDLLDAQSALLQSETNYAGALADLHIALERLTLATGEKS